MAWLFLSVFFSVVVFLAVYFVAERFGNGSVCALAVVTTVISLILMFPILAFQCFGTLVLALICIPLKAKPGTIMACSMTAALVSYGFGFYVTLHQLREVHQLQREYPVLSLESRLAHEQTREVASVPPEAPRLSQDVATRLGNFEAERNFGTMRERMLSRLHQSNQLDFVLAQGFGVTRMAHISRSRIDLPEVVPILLPDPVEEYEPDVTQPPLANANRHDVRQPEKQQLAGTHYQVRYDFLDKERMGYVEGRSEVIGFEPHQFSHMPTVNDDDEWQVTRLELISLLRQSEPLAYVSDHLPNMEELTDVPTRHLNAFERSALNRLRSEEDVVIQEGVNQIRMMGSLRAGRDCLECHSVQRGELIGAFSYDIQRVRPMPEPKPVEPQASIQWSNIRLASDSQICPRMP